MAAAAPKASACFSAGQANGHAELLPGMLNMVMAELNGERSVEFKERLGIDSPWLAALMADMHLNTRLFHMRSPSGTELDIGRKGQVLLFVSQVLSWHPRSDMRWNDVDVEGPADPTFEPEEAYSTFQVPSKNDRATTDDPRRARTSKKQKDNNRYMDMQSHKGNLNVRRRDAKDKKYEMQWANALILSRFLALRRHFCKAASSQPNRAQVIRMAMLEIIMSEFGFLDDLKIETRAYCYGTNAWRILCDADDLKVETRAYCYSTNAWRILCDAELCLEDSTAMALRKLCWRGEESSDDTSGVFDFLMMMLAEERSEGGLEVDHDVLRKRSDLGMEALDLAGSPLTMASPSFVYHDRQIRNQNTFIQTVDDEEW